MSDEELVKLWKHLDMHIKKAQERLRPYYEEWQARFHKDRSFDANDFMRWGDEFVKEKD